MPSQQVATYDLAPEMSAHGVTDVLCKAIGDREHDFILCNYANGDMVGHTGSLPATLEAVRTVDACLARVIAEAERAGARLLITADHGNCEMMIDPATGGPHTAHTTNPVPFLLIDPDGDRALRRGGALCDVGPTILNMLDLHIPAEMTGTDLRDAGDRMSAPVRRGALALAMIAALQPRRRGHRWDIRLRPAPSATSCTSRASRPKPDT